MACCLEDVPPVLPPEVLPAISPMLVERKRQKKTENLPRSCRVTARLPRIARLHILVFNKILIYALRMVRLATLLAAWRRCPSPRNLDLDPLSCSKTVCLAIYPGDPANPYRASLGRFSGALGRCTHINLPALRRQSSTHWTSSTHYETTHSQNGRVPKKLEHGSTDL